MSKELSTFKYQTKSGHKYGYRFEIASISGTRKWYSERGYDRKADALKAGRERMMQYDNKGYVVTPSDMSYSDFLDMWIKSLEGICKISTLENYKKKARLYIKPYIGERKLCTITKEDIRDLLLELATHGCKNSNKALADTTLSVIKGIVCKSFNFAIDEKLLAESPVKGRLVIPTELYVPSKYAANKSPHVYIPPQNIAMIFERFPQGSPSYTPMMLGYKCGLRIGEAYAVSWDDIDFVKKILHVRYQIQWISSPTSTANQSYARRAPRREENNFGKWYLSPPKYKSSRDIRIDDQLLEHLAKEQTRQEQQRELLGDRYVEYYVDANGDISTSPSERSRRIRFINVREDGEYITSRTMQHTSRIIHSELNYPEFDFHSLRHTHATLLAENGADPYYVMKRLGHKNLEVTLRVYYHYTDKMDEVGNYTLNGIFTR